MPDHDFLSDAERKALSDLNKTPEPTAMQQVLLVEDDDDSRELLAEILGVHGITCVTAASAVDGLALLTNNKNIGLLITDLKMRPYDGLQLISEIRASDRAALPIIIVSGNADVQDAIAAMHLSVVDFLLKPVDINRLVMLVKRELGL